VSGFNLDQVSRQLAEVRSPIEMFVLHDEAERHSLSSYYPCAIGFKGPASAERARFCASHSLNPAGVDTPTTRSTPSRFTEGFDTANPQRAKRLFAELA
jgi:hypothetical protein